MKKDGTCVDCIEGTIASWDITECIQIVKPKCGAREVEYSDGTCYPCPNYTIPDTTKTTCQYARCMPNQIILITGACEHCEYGETTSADQHICLNDNDANWEVDY